MLLRRDVEIILRLNNRIDVRFIFARRDDYRDDFFSRIYIILSMDARFSLDEKLNETVNRIFLARATIQIRLYIVVYFREFL